MPGFRKPDTQHPTPITLGPDAMSSFSLYVHIPYCQAKCPYCDFNSHVVPNRPEQAYVDALCAELRHYAQRTPWLGGRVDTVFFGGGTPSLFTPASIGKILDAIAARWSLATNAETTLEANPGTVSLEQLRGFRAAGINRISFGVQSFAAHHLHTLGRIHGGPDALAAVVWAQQARFASVSVDLIFGLPNQTLQEWESDLMQACALGPHHVSAYNLTYEEGTPFHLWRSQGKLRQLEDETEAAMFSRTQSILGDAGYRQYEISNYAQPGHMCRHNLNYWRSGPYLGVGAGAHSHVPSRGRTVEVLHDHPNRRHPELFDFAQDEHREGSRHECAAANRSEILRCAQNDIDCFGAAKRVPDDFPTVPDVAALPPWGWRWSNEKNPGRYMQAIETHGHARSGHETLDQRQARGEFVFLGLRCRQGFAAAVFRDRFGGDLLDVFPHVVELRADGLLVYNDGHWQLTPRGLLLADSVFATFL